MNNSFSINKQKINNEQTINKRNKVTEDFMNNMDDKK